MIAAIFASTLVLTGLPVLDYTQAQEQLYDNVSEVGHADIRRRIHLGIDRPYDRRELSCQLEKTAMQIASRFQVALDNGRLEDRVLTEEDKATLLKEMHYMQGLADQDRVDCGA